MADMVVQDLLVAALVVARRVLVRYAGTRGRGGVVLARGRRSGRYIRVRTLDVPRSPALAVPSTYRHTLAVYLPAPCQPGDRTARTAYRADRWVRIVKPGEPVVFLAAALRISPNLSLLPSQHHITPQTVNNI